MNDRLDGDQMDHDPADTAPDPSAPLSREEWLAMVDELCAEEGYFEPVGQHHHAFFHLQFSRV